MAEVTERWSEQSLTLGSRATRVFDVTSVDNIKLAGDALYSEELIREGSEHPHDGRLTVPSGGIDIKGGKGNRNFVATVQYESPSGSNTSNDDLLNKKWTTSVVIEKAEEPVDRDYNNKPIVNSARQPFSVQDTRPFTSATITLWRWESSYQLSKHLAYEHKWNSDSVVLPKLGTAAPGELMVDSIHPREEFDVDAAQIPVVYVFKARRRFTIGSTLYHGFYRRKMDLGTMGNNATGINPITFATGTNKGQPVSSEVRLNGYGVPLDTTNFNVGGVAGVNLASAPGILDVTADAVFILYDITEGSIAFSGLNISANL